ncbi:hypothetical protein A2W54_03970 [Candidatus Giovannonibacteria bacterium RIFCSPHIGHO2_02_43_13]|uniref:Uncharacterized protein n=1 Tax=Candidatus Giovannonibacteria bacterium RIFCSPHIGHO2_02_43_13 TaxID=1798330 RepID=A0A1F5WS26_9BACT|nr:MAG: hypothetical protein UW28_C0029G0002 [Parcubacteria group bacterium GW2011_GWA2_44_13]OGF73303.1 MAG: hypothetical protein A3E06_03410 [Candidatus Giovannonibacteria bacterium RIFCSPHIGHO2_12_FULL_44_42]OGF78475.1 MAG: hypothetical protein A2W54_03970 [Candidatus Giovannonibacteria bacterium RIFCSPHIGHO2_02_43_13]OGF89424.1 MAG: hypothetical protein A3I94_01560 [Candidatus Giovannonibacteria bacterium RIFCSPLOWO2_02_FULL_43_54]OGF97462.1 MAG: hypothetical protein A3H08_02735 [Candidatus
MKGFFRTSVFLALAPIIAGAKTIDEIISVVEREIISPIKFLLIVGAAVLFLYGVVEMIMGASNEEARTTGKRHMIWGLIGLVIIVGVGAIIDVLKNFFAY